MLNDLLGVKLYEKIVIRNYELIINTTYMYLTMSTKYILNYKYEIHSYL